MLIFFRRDNQPKTKIASIFLFFILGLKSAQNKKTHKVIGILKKFIEGGVQNLLKNIQNFQKFFASIFQILP
jgi:hypothetical protein